MSPRNVALIAVGAVALLAIGFTSGRRVEADANKPGQTNVSSQPLVPAYPPKPSATPSAAPKPTAAPLRSGDPITGLFERLEAERANRPKLEPTAESVFEVLKTKGSIVEEQHIQVAGWTVGAKFCDKVRTTKDVHIVVCEFATEADAIAGQKETSNNIKRREVLRNKTTTCAVHQPGEDAASATQAARAKELFKAM